MKIYPILLLAASWPVLAQEPRAGLHCKPTATDYVYHCTIRLTRDGKPLPGLAVTVGADMPSMPMAHAVKPVKAKPAKSPGAYQASLDLEMLGVWAVTLDLGGPANGRLVLLYDFDEKGARPVTRSGKPPRN